MKKFSVVKKQGLVDESALPLATSFAGGIGVGCLCGAIAGMVDKVEPAKDMIEEMFRQAEELLSK